MKLVKTASGKDIIKISKNEWKAIGKKAGWLNKKAQSQYGPYDQKMIDEAKAKVSPDKVRDIINYDLYEMNKADAMIHVSDKYDLPFEYVIGCVDYHIK